MILSDQNFYWKKLKKNNFFFPQNLINLFFFTRKIFSLLFLFQFQDVNLPSIKFPICQFTS
jgi:hypothetical protein